jgi:hypothetical protein
MLKTLFAALVGLILGVGLAYIAVIIVPPPSPALFVAGGASDAEIVKWLAQLDHSEPDWFCFQAVLYAGGLGAVAGAAVGWVPLLKAFAGASSNGPTP